MAKRVSRKELIEDALTNVDKGIKVAKSKDVNGISNIANSSLFTEIQSLHNISNHMNGHDSKKNDAINKLWGTINKICSAPQSASTKTFKKMKKELRKL